MYPLKNWPNQTPAWTNESLEVLSNGKTIVEPPSDLALESLIQKSAQFPIKFPIEAVRCSELKTNLEDEVLERNINSAYPVIHEIALHLYASFILHKRRYGSEIERGLYKNMSVLDLIQRLLIKRAAMFMGRFDSYILLNGTKGTGKWDTIGKTGESGQLQLKDCISYDEIKLSALLSVSSYTYFINDGNRKNKGVPSKDRNKIQPEGIIMGLIGS